MIHENEASYVFPMHLREVLKKSDPRYKSQKSRDAEPSEITRLLNRKAPSFFPEKDIPTDSNVLVSRIMMAIKTQIPVLKDTKRNSSYKVKRTMKMNSVFIPQKQ